MDGRRKRAIGRLAAECARAVLGTGRLAAERGILQNSRFVFHRIDRRSEICGVVPICTIRARRRAAHLAMHISILPESRDIAGGS